MLEAHSVTGARDLLCRVVARDNGHLQDVINRMVRHPAVRRSTSYISMSRRCGPLRSNALRLPLPRRGERVGVRGLRKITSISIKETRRPPPSPAPARPLPATRLAMKKTGLTEDRFMFAQRPKPLTPALSPKGRGSNAGQLAVARFEVMHCGSLSPGGGRGLG
ncbi:MAG: Lrp/AsnC ligand binding domain-containing protein [Burkholderiales bacterium]|nr:Lrp/AsnC ligand binding domain-containing protein [Burkholderiales bacterium]